MISLLLRNYLLNVRPCKTIKFCSALLYQIQHRLRYTSSLFCNCDSPTNYRPISLLSVVSKHIERHIHFLLTLQKSSDFWTACSGATSKENQLLPPCRL